MGLSCAKEQYCVYLFCAEKLFFVVMTRLQFVKLSLFRRGCNIKDNMLKYYIYLYYYEKIFTISQN